MVNNVWLSVPMLVLLATPPAAEGGWVIEWKNTPINKETRQDTQIATAYIDSNQSRMEQDQLTTIYDYNKAKFAIMNPKSKFFWSGSIDEYVKVSSKRRDEALRNRTGNVEATGSDELPEIDAASLPEITIERSGESKQVAGYETTKYVIKVNDELFQELWIAEALDLTKDIDPAKFAKYQQQSSRGMIGASSKPYNALYRSAAYLDLLKKGFALETLTHHLAGSFEQSAKSIRKADVDPASFAPPEDYRRVQLMDVFKFEE